MGLHDSKLQEVKWHEETSLNNSRAAYSSVTTEKHALELAKIVNKENPMTAFILATDGGYRIEILRDEGLKLFREKFPSVKVDEPRTHLKRYRNGYKTTTESTRSL